MFGWMGKVLRVNLTNGEITKEPLEKELAHKYVGGRGFTIGYLYDALRPGINPLGAENSLVFAPGLACGTLLPSSQRWTVGAKSPMTGFIGDSNCGGSFGIGLKYAGYDMLIIEGCFGELEHMLAVKKKISSCVEPIQLIVSQASGKFGS